MERIWNQKPDNINIFWYSEKEVIILGLTI